MSTNAHGYRSFELGSFSFRRLHLASVGKRLLQVARINVVSRYQPVKDTCVALALVQPLVEPS